MAAGQHFAQKGRGVAMASAVERAINAGRFGFVFLRNKWFAMPSKIRVCGMPIQLTFPDEGGVKTDFVACIIRNDYGLRRRLGTVRTILDIGANLGWFSLSARNFYPQAKIHAYEPNPRIIPYLEANTSHSNINVFTSAVGRIAGQVSMEDTGNSNAAIARVSDDGRIEQVSFETAVSRLGNEVDLLKLDCEGGEWELFEAGHAWRAIRELRMEYHLTDSHSVEDVFRRLDALGFSVIRHEPDQKWGIIWASNRLFQLPTG
jgi:FkbM family methyltransferase